MILSGIFISLPGRALLTHASRIGSSVPLCSKGCARTYAKRSSNPFDFVLSSFLERFLKATTTFASLIDVRFGGSARYDNVLVAEVEPKPEKPVPKAARLLEAWDLNCRLLMLCEIEFFYAKGVLVKMSFVKSLGWFMEGQSGRRLMRMELKFWKRERD
jgi:hypothetical protein